MNTYHDQLNGFAGYCAGRGVLRDNRCGERFAKKSFPYHSEWQLSNFLPSSDRIPRLRGVQKMKLLGGVYYSLACFRATLKKWKLETGKLANWKLENKRKLARLITQYRDMFFSNISEGTAFVLQGVTEIIKTRNWNLESGIRHPESGIGKPESRCRNIPMVTAPLTFGFSRQKVGLLTGFHYLRVVACIACRRTNFPYICYEG